MPAISALLIGICLVVIGIWYRSRGTGRRVRKLEAELASVIRRRRKPERINQYLIKVFTLLQQGLAAKNISVCYQAVELLKTAYGAGITRSEELPHIVGISVMALREKQIEITSILVDAARLVVRRQSACQAELALDQLQLLATIALREKQNFIAAKTAELIFYILEKDDCQAGSTVSLKALTALRAIGALVIRRRDSFMLREVIGNFMNWYEQADAATDTAVAELMAAWLHRSLYSSDTTAFEIVGGFITKTIEVRGLEPDALRLLTVEIKNMAGTFSLDPGNPVAASLVKMMLDLGFAQGKVEESQRAVKAVGEIARLAIHDHDLNVALPILFPLLDYGRKMLTIELKFGGEASDGGHRQHTLFFIIKECLAVMEYTARKRMTDSVADIADEFMKYWRDCPETMHTFKSFRKFCSLLLLYHAASRRQKPATLHQQTGNLALFTEREQERLKVFIGGIQYELLSGTSRKV